MSGLRGWKLVHIRGHRFWRRGNSFKPYGRSKR